MQPPEPRETAWGYVWRQGLAWKYGYIGPLAEIGLRAAALARGGGIEEDRIPEGPFIVHTWPPWVWQKVIAEMEAPPIPPAVKTPADEEIRYPSRLWPGDSDQGWGEGGVPWDGDD